MLPPVLAVVLGLLVAAAFGAGDFSGGRASQSSSTAGVLLVSQVSAAAGAIAVALMFSADISGHDLALGACAGALNVVALGLLYQGLSTGRMSVVAPVTAVVGAIFPITWGLLQGERPSALVLVGVAAAVVAGALIGITTQGDSAAGDARRALMTAVAAGLGFGGSFILFARTSSESGNWPVLAARVSAVALVVTFVALLATRRTIAFPKGRDRLVALGAGALDVTATALLLLAVRHGLIVVVAPIAALAPAMTVVLSWALLKERIAKPQLLGLMVALPALVLIAAG
jgi:drug/metabolite transporter (DMT)-like permease